MRDAATTKLTRDQWLSQFAHEFEYVEQSVLRCALCVIAGRHILPMQSSLSIRTTCSGKVCTDAASMLDGFVTTHEASRRQPTRSMCVTGEDANALKIQ